MHTLTVDVARLRFPDRCLRCRGPARASHKVRAGSEIVRAPLCSACAGKSLRYRVAWIALSLLGAAALVVVAAMFLEVLVPLPADPDARRTWGMLVAFVLLGLAATGAVLAIRYALRRHRTSWLPVSVVKLEGARVQLAVADAELARDIASLSGELAAAPPTGAPYREAPEPVVAYQPKAAAGGFLLPLAFAVVAAIAGIMRISELSPERLAEGPVSVHIVEGLFFDLWGRWGVVGFWAFAFVLFAALAWSSWRSRFAESDGD